MSEFRNLIGGRWVPSSSGATFESRNPARTDDVIGQFPAATAEDARKAIAAARQALPNWANTPPPQRGAILEKAAQIIDTRADELAKALTREEGKTYKEALGEVLRARDIFRYYAGEGWRMGGQTFPSNIEGELLYTRREPLGVVAIITPWNFPIAIPAWKIAPALAFGNCVVFKPADLVPGSAWALTEILSRAGLPAGVFNLVMGRGSVVGEAILEAPEIDAVSFTGSIETGRHIAAVCAAGMKKFQLEMGGKNPLVVLDDADLDNAVNCAIQGAFYSTGQRCTASSRLIVTAGIHDRFVEAVIAAMKDLVVGDALAEGTQIGPVVDQNQLDQDLRYLEIGQQEGARLAFGGRLLERDSRGFYLEPALFVDTRNDMRINREEIFGPIVSVIRVADYEEALAVANDTRFGLSSGICTRSLKHASHFRERAEAGMVMVNLPTAGVDYHVPFGGRKASSYGPREQGRYAVEFYTTVKTAYTLPL